MSKFTKPNTEQSVTCGFYNNDPKYEKPRKYDAMQMSRIFDGVINDGIFKTIGECFVVRANSGNTVNVGPGKAWFNHTWTENDAILPVDCGDSEQLLDRIDALVIDIDARPEVADNTITVVKGTPSSYPNRPVLLNEDDHHQHALCYIYRKAESTQITDADITNVVGTDETPYITGILETTSRDDWFAQWRAELDQFVEEEKAKATDEINTYVNTNEADFTAWYSEMKQHMDDVVAETDEWVASQKNTISDWFGNMQNTIGEDSAINLQIQVDRGDIERILVLGLPDGVKNISEDGTTIVSTDSLNRTLTKTFSNGFATCTTVLTDTYGTELGRSVKNYSSDGRVISTETTILHQNVADISNILSSVSDITQETLDLQNQYLE
jgi:hypothetical protein